MRAVVQRVSHASVSIHGTVYGSIRHGLLILLGIESEDTMADADWLALKIASMRIFNDENGKMNLGVNDVSGECLLVSQFTLHALTAKGNRPSFIKAARPEQAIPLYEYFIKRINENINKPVQTGEFGADMQVELLNDGPVTIVIDSKQRD
jgi:D-tyrosyl-tRNA(Tyr) deacylase